ncbi:ATP-binding protein [Colwellia piezophila]|uniref:ATP-binding protein n=1 Tax=Colwellia piezophila TaxID=211668 RepID=UPI0012F98CDC|nr:ATP-binding protein [Colwellia piezophila]
MMERLKQSLLVISIVGSIGVGIFQQAFAQDTKVDQLLAEIKQLANKESSLTKLSLLLATADLSASAKVDILLQQAKTFFTLDQYYDALKSAKQAQKIAQQAMLPEAEARANKLQGIIYYYQGELKPALKAYRLSLVYYEANQAVDTALLSIKRANLLNNMALVYIDLGQPNLALLSYQEAEPLYARYGDEEDKIDVRFNIAILHISLGHFDSAIDMLTVTIAKRLKLKDGHGVAAARATLGTAYKHSGQIELAKEKFLAALSYFQKHDYQHDIASQMHNLAEIYNDSFNVKQAVYYAQKALLLSEKVGHQKAYAGSLHSLAKASFYSGELAQAKQYIEQSTIVATKKNYQNILDDNLAMSALINAGQQKFVAALTEQQNYIKITRIKSNTKLNEQLAKFESAQLNQKIVQLEQQRKLQDLESVKVEQQRNLIILTLVLVLVVVFFIYRRYLGKRLTKELELRVKQRTRELEELTQELEKANEVKSQFLANMSHEIRTPLTAIVGHAEAIIHDDIDKDKVQQDIEVIHGNSLHLLDLINDILDLSRIEANKFTLEIQSLDLAELIQDLSNTFTSQAQLKGLDFIVEHQLSLPFIIQVDSLRLKQILINLCANAIKFTEKGQVTLTIAWQEQQLSFTVVDTGIGLSKENLAQVFEIFTQADNSISRRFGGSGLGLTLSNQLAKLMLGRITATSKLGQGSSFCLALPCQHYSNQPINASNHAGDKALANSALDDNYDHLFKGKILLAEDHDDNRRLITRLLTSLGLEVIVAKNGKEAVKLCVQHQPHLVFLDIQMPEMDGVEAFKALRALGCNQAIYALTANAMSHEVSNYLALGFTGHLKKPIERKHFIAIIAKYFTDTNKSDAADNQHGQYALSESELSDRAAQTLAQVDLSDLVTEFKANLSQVKRELILYNEQVNLDKLTQVAHSLAGAAQMFGFIELNQAAQELERIIKQELIADNANHVLISDLNHCLVDEINLIEQQ